MARIKLITLPVRERVEIQLDNPDATLVEEERIVPLVKGVNQVDFSWANTRIDPNTIVFRVIGGTGEAPKAAAVEVKPLAKEAKLLDVKVLSVSYPPNEAALVWQVSSSDSGSARVRISYLLGNLTKSFNYRAVATHDEKTLVLSEYIRIQNLANEWFGFDRTLGRLLYLGVVQRNLIRRNHITAVRSPRLIRRHQDVGKLDLQELLLILTRLATGQQRLGNMLAISAGKHEFGGRLVHFHDKVKVLHLHFARAAAATEVTGAGLGFPPRPGLDIDLAFVFAVSALAINPFDL